MCVCSVFNDNIVYDSVVFIFIKLEIFSLASGETKLKSLREEKMRQLLWETSPELQELRKQVLMADVAKDQAMQVAEKGALAELKRQEEESLAAAAEEEKRKFEEERRKQEELEFQAKLKYHKELDDLRQFKASKQDATEEELRNEKAAIDEIKKQIEEEDLERERKRIEVIFLSIKFCNILLLFSFIFMKT